MLRSNYVAEAVLKLKENTMGIFITTNRGWVNLDHVARVTDRKVKLHSRATSEVSRAVLFGPEDTELGLALYLDADRVAEKAQPLVPATPGAEVLVFWMDNDEDERPVADNVTVSREPIVAWRIDACGHGGACPVLLEDPVSSSFIGFTLPDGRVMFPYDCTCDDLAAAKAYVLGRAQTNWDEEHLDAAAA
jgi:hypothetical protein